MDLFYLHERWNVDILPHSRGKCLGKYFPIPWWRRSFSEVFPGFTAPEVSGKKHGKDSLRVHIFLGGELFSVTDQYYYWLLPNGGISQVALEIKVRSVSVLSCHFSIVGAACEVIFVCEFCLWILLMSTVEFDKKNATCSYPLQQTRSWGWAYMKILLSSKMTGWWNRLKFPWHGNPWISYWIGHI